MGREIEKIKRRGEKKEENINRRQQFNNEKGINDVSRKDKYDHTDESDGS